MKSPCVNICVVDPVSKYCIGCGRTRDEIAFWVKFSNEDREGVMEALPERMKTITNSRKRGASRGRRKNRAGANQ